jgi:hypothetical protein
MRRWLIVGTLVVVAGLGGSVAAAKSGLWLGGPHRVSAPRARLDPALSARINEELGTANVKTIDQAIAFALGVSARQLHFGLQHRTRLWFGLAEREGHCIEYAHLFATVIGRVARARDLPLDAYVVHSPRARMFGYRLPMRGLDDHDWVLVVDRCSGQRHFVDPTFADMGLGADIKDAVEPPVMVPVPAQSPAGPVGAAGGSGSTASRSACRSASSPSR